MRNRSTAPFEEPGGWLAARDPANDRMRADDGVEHAVGAIGAWIASQPRERPQGPRRRAGVPGLRRWALRSRALLAAGAAVAVVGGGGAVAATVLSAHTGDHPSSPAQVRMGGPGEYLDLTAPDARSVLLGIAADIPYPQGYASWRDYQVGQDIAMTGGSSPSEVSTGAVHGWFAASAFCAWVRAWREHRVAGDASAARRAAGMVSGALAWPAVTDEDPHPDAAVPGDGGTTRASLFGWMIPYRDAVRSGSLPRVDRLLASGYGDKCWASDPGWNRVLARPGSRTLDRAQLEATYRRFLAGARR